MDSHAGTKRNIDLNPICLEKLTQNEQRLKHKPYRKKKKNKNQEQFLTSKAVYKIKRC